MKTTIALILTTSSLLAGGDKTTTKHTAYVTNFVQVPILCAPLEMADLTLTPGHVYRLYVADGQRPWRNWGTLRPGSNSAVRVWFPAASTRAMAWQVVDNTPGFPQVAVTKQAPDCLGKAQWVILGVGNIRPAK